MNLYNYIKNPIWGITRINRKILYFFRGFILKLTYKTGPNLKVGKNVIIDLLDLSISNNVTLSSNVKIFGKGKVYIGSNTFIGENTIICSDNLIAIGSDTLIAPNCYITDTNHGTRGIELIRKQKMRTTSLFIGNNVWIGTNSNILSGAKILDNSVVGASSTINFFIEDNSFVVPKKEFIITKRK